MKLFFLLSLFFICFGLKAQSPQKDYSEKIKSLEAQIEEKKALYEKVEKIRKDYILSENKKSVDYFYPDRKLSRWSFYVPFLGLGLPLLIYTEIYTESKSYDKKGTKASETPSLFDAEANNAEKTQSKKIHPALSFLNNHKAVKFLKDNQAVKLMKKHKTTLIAAVVVSALYEVYRSNHNAKHDLYDPEGFKQFLHEYEVSFPELRIDTFLMALDQSIHRDERLLDHLMTLDSDNL